MAPALNLKEQNLRKFLKIYIFRSMKAFALLRSGDSRLVSFAALAVLPLLALALAGCGDVESTNTETATCTLNPSATFAVEQDPPPETEPVVTTNVVDGITNTTTTAADSTAITQLGVAATSPGGTTWSVQASDNAGNIYSGSATGPAVFEPGGDNAYAAGATIATFALECSGLSGEISAVALVNIPLEVVRTTSTNGTNVVVGRHGQHTLTPQNAEYRLSASVAGGEVTLSGSAPVNSATIIW